MDKNKIDAEIDLEALKHWIIELIDAAQKDLGISKIKLSDDFYWLLDSKVKYCITSNPVRSDMSIGQLYDDLEFLNTASEDHGSLSRASLCHAVPLLSYVDYYVNEKVYDDENS